MSIPRLWILGLVALLLVAACGDADEAEPSASQGVQVEEFADVWVFTHSPEASNEALHGGVAEIRGGCLTVDEAVVVWPQSQLSVATDLIERIQGGELPEVTISGGGISLDEGASLEDIPEAIRQRCDVRAVWFGAP